MENKRLCSLCKEDLSLKTNLPELKKQIKFLEDELNLLNRNPDLSDNERSIKKSELKSQISTVSKKIVKDQEKFNLNKIHRAICPYEKYRNLIHFFCIPEIKMILATKYKKDLSSLEIDNLKLISNLIGDEELNDYYEYDSNKTNQFKFDDLIYYGNHKVFLIKFLSLLFDIYLRKKLHFRNNHQHPMKDYFSYMYLTHTIANNMYFGNKDGNYNNLSDITKPNLVIYKFGDAESSNAKFGDQLYSLFEARISIGLPVWLICEPGYTQTREYKNSDKLQNLVKSERFYAIVSKDNKKEQSSTEEIKTEDDPVSKWIES